MKYILLVSTFIYQIIFQKVFQGQENKFEIFKILPV